MAIRTETMKVKLIINLGGLTKLGTDIRLKIEKYENGRWKVVDTDINKKRCYWSFSVMADVRNHGCIPSVYRPKGLPSDISEESKLYFQEVHCHSASWLTLEELFNFNWNTTIRDYLFMTGEEKKNYEKDGSLPDFFGGKINATEPTEFVETIIPIKKKARLCLELIKTMNRIGESDKVRVVFGFV